MSDHIRLACETEILQIPIGKILPTHRLDDSIRKTSKYRCIEASIKELGLIEPLEWSRREAPLTANVAAYTS